MKNLLIAGFVVGLLTSCAKSPDPVSNSVASRTPTATPPIATGSSPSPSPSPASKRADAQTLSRAAAILSSNTDHYEQQLAQAKKLLGAKQFSSPYEGLAALDEAGSNARRFSDFNRSLVSGDMSFQDAFKDADALFTGDNEPDSIETWREDIMDVSADLANWGNAAINWQIKKITTAKLGGLEQKAKSDIAKARNDIASLRKGK